MDQANTPVKEPVPVPPTIMNWAEAASNAFSGIWDWEQMALLAWQVTGCQMRRPACWRVGIASTGDHELHSSPFAGLPSNGGNQVLDSSVARSANADDEQTLTTGRTPAVASSWHAKTCRQAQRSGIPRESAGCCIAIDLTAATVCITARICRFSFQFQLTELPAL